MFSLNRSIVLPADFVLAFQANRPELYPKRALSEDESIAVCDALKAFHETLVDTFKDVERLENLVDQLKAASQQVINNLNNASHTLRTELDRE